jgi:hypothetical protein
VCSAQRETRGLGIRGFVGVLLYKISAYFVAGLIVEVNSPGIIFEIITSINNDADFPCIRGCGVIR